MDSATLYLIRVAVLALTVAPIAVAAYVANARDLPAWLTVERRQLLLAALVTVGWIHFIWHIVVFGTNPGHDALAYWAVDFEALYHDVYGTDGLFVYSPAIALLASLLALLPQSLFLAGWAAVSAIGVVWLARRETLIWMAFPPLVWLLVIGNIEVLIGVAVVLGFRHAWAWSFVLLTKVTPAVGLLWFVVRGEWRNVLVALGATLAVVAATYVIVPDAWPAWVEFLLRSQGSGGWLPLVPRMLAAAALVAWGGRTNRPWTVLVGAIFAVPHFWFASLGGLVALAALGFSWVAAIRRVPRGSL